MTIRSLNWVFFILNDSPGVEVTKTISPVPSFLEFFSIVKTQASYGMSRFYLTFVATVHLRWHLPNMNSFNEYDRNFCEIKSFAHGETSERSFNNPDPRYRWSISK